MSRTRLLPLLCLGLLLCGCVSQTVTSNSVPAVRTAQTAIPEDLLLDVGIVVFDPGLEDLSEEDARLVYPEIRKAEGHFVAARLSEALQNSGSWGAVRVIPNAEQAVDILVEGRIVQSDGETLELAIEATDARGNTWLDREYLHTSSSYAYRVTTRSSFDPFQAMYNHIANDLLDVLERTAHSELRDIRLVNELRFAGRFSEEAFAGYIEPSGDGSWQVVRLPAEDDPMLNRVRRIRERDRIFIDTLQDYYLGFDERMAGPYQEWRKLSYEETVAMREVQTRARTQLVTGGLAVIAGILAASSGESGYDGALTRTAGWVAISGGGQLLKAGLQSRQEAEIHVEALEELSVSLEEEITPQVIELEDRTITLSGSIEQQYNQWRDILGDIYEAEVGSLPQPEDIQDGAGTL